MVSNRLHFFYIITIFKYVTIVGKLYLGVNILRKRNTAMQVNHIDTKIILSNRKLYRNNLVIDISNSIICSLYRF